ncbi:MAG: hypothetical protein IJA32_00075 [Lachnospiraceae bacterium]|nr:hypothetical protein [Lachnospiraceae bacterium]
MINNNNYTGLALSPSPFHLEDTWCVLKENKNHNCTHAEIDTLAAKGLLNGVDFEIMKLLSVYPFVNTYNLEYALLHGMSEFYQKSEYTKNLHKLVKAGILIKYCLADKTVGEEPMIVSPFRFYSLSPGAYSYMSSFMNNPHDIQFCLRDRQIIEVLSVVQLLIHTNVAYPDCIKKQRLCVRKKIGNKQVVIPTYLVFQSEKEQPPLHLLVLSGRAEQGSREKLIGDVQTLFEWLNKNEEPYRNYMILLLLENLHEIPVIQSQINNGHTRGKLHPVYYSLDTNLLTHPLFDCIYQCEEIDGKPHIDRIRFRFTRTDY